MPLFIIQKYKYEKRNKKGKDELGNEIKSIKKIKRNEKERDRILQRWGREVLYTPHFKS